MAMKSFTYNDIYKIAEKRYPCPNGLISTQAYIKGKIDAFIEGFQEAMKLGVMETDSNSSDSNSSDSNWSTYYPY